MRALTRALERDIETAQIKVPWKSLDALSLKPLRGSLLVVLGQPGSGKSAFALNWAVKSLYPSVCLSWDTDLRTQALRLCSILSGRSLGSITSMPRLWSQFLQRNHIPIQFFDRFLRIGELSEVIAAQTEYWGESPALTIVDNVSNLIREGGYEEYRKVFVELHRLARQQDTLVVALHHVNRGLIGSQVVLTSGQYSGEQEAEIVLGLSNSRKMHTLDVAILKNRYGPAHAKGHMRVQLSFNKENMQIDDLTEDQTTLQTLAQI